MIARKTIEKQLDDLWREIIYYKFNFVCEMCYRKLGEEECHAHHIIGRRNYNVRWDEDNGSLLCNYCHNWAKTAPHFSPKNYLEWLSYNRPEGFYKKLLRKSGEKGGSIKWEITELLQKKMEMGIRLKQLIFMTRSLS